MMTLETLFVSLNAFLLAIVTFFLKQTWDEIKSLRVSRHEHANLLTAHTVQIDNLNDDVQRLQAIENGKD